MYKERLRRILASEGMLKSSTWLGAIYVGDGSRDPSGHPDFAEAMAWAKKVSSNKTLIDNTRNDRPFEKITIELVRGGGLQIGISGTVEEEEKTWEEDTYPSVGGDFTVSSNGRWEHHQVLVSREVAITEVGGNWVVEASSYSGYKKRMQTQNTSNSLRTALRFALRILNTMA